MTAAEIIGWIGMGLCVAVMIAAVLHRGKEHAREHNKEETPQS